MSVTMAGSFRVKPSPLPGFARFRLGSKPWDSAKPEVALPLQSGKVRVRHGEMA